MSRLVTATYTADLGGVGGQRTDVVAVGDGSGGVCVAAHLGKLAHDTASVTAATVVGDCAYVVAMIKGQLGGAVHTENAHDTACAPIGSGDRAGVDRVLHGQGDGMTCVVAVHSY